MKEAIEVLTAGNTTRDQRLDALQALQYLVEPIDNANDLKVLEGLQPLIAALEYEDAELQRGAAAVLGVAAQNNVKFHSDLLDAYPATLSTLLKVAGSDNADTQSQALYAISALVRNSPEARKLLYKAGGLGHLQEALTGKGSPLRVRRKALNLIYDLAIQDSQLKEQRLRSPELFKAVLQLLNEDDADLQEKALLAIQTLANETEENRQVFIEQGGIGELQALSSRFRDTLKQQEHPDDDSEYVQEVAKLAQHVLEGLDAGSKSKDEL